MQGHIEARGKGWRIFVEAGRDPKTGRRKQITKTVHGNKADAQRVMRQMILSVETGGFIRPKEKMTTGEWLKEWLGSYVSTNCSPRTLASYEMLVRCHITPELGMVPLAQLEARHLQAFYSRKLAEGRIGARTIRYCHSLLSEALGYGIKMGMVGRNVALSTDPPRAEHKTMTTLAAEDVPLFLETASKTPHYTLYYTLLYTGMRRGEALALKWKNVDLDVACLSILETGYKLNGQYIIKEPKTPSSRRQIALTASLASLLRDHRAKQNADALLMGRPLTRDDFVFGYADGKPLDPSTVSHYFHKILKTAGLPQVRLHDLRHTHASLMLKAGVHPKIVGERLGHASVRITLDTYSHVLPGLQEAAAQRFEDFLASKGQH